MILDTIVKATHLRLERKKIKVPIKELLAKIDDKNFEATIHNRQAFAFEKALKKKDKICFICEVKKASPSKGIISKDFPYLSIAKEYEEAGADAISVLTEPEYFMGKDSYLREISSSSNIPVIRKDFIIDEYQIYEAKV